jgi:hypothetical protein
MIILLLNHSPVESPMRVPETQPEIQSTPVPEIQKMPETEKMPETQNKPTKLLEPSMRVPETQPEMQSTPVPEIQKMPELRTMPETQRTPMKLWAPVPETQKLLLLEVRPPETQLEKQSTPESPLSAAHASESADHSLPESKNEKIGLLGVGMPVGLGSSPVSLRCHSSPDLSLLAVDLSGSFSGMEEENISEAAGLEEIGSEMVSSTWVVEKCLDFCPKVGISDDGRKEDLGALFHSIEDTRGQPESDRQGISVSTPAPKGKNELKRLACSLEGSQTKSVSRRGRGRGRHGGL